MRNIKKLGASSLYSPNKDQDGTLNLSYSNRTRILNIHLGSSKSPVLEIPFAGRAGFSNETTHTYIALLKKAVQTHALVYSNNETVFIENLIDEQKLPSILEYTAEIAFLALKIKEGRYSDFKNRVVHDFGLKEMCFKKVCSPYYKRGHFKARVKLMNDKRVMVRACKEHTALSELSQHVIHDLVAHEYTNNNEKRASQLMTLASRLAFIAKIIDPDFNPEKQLV